jgi:excisionase family DNA binding protein
MGDGIIQLLSAKVTAQKLGVALPTLRAWCSQRRIPYLKLGRRVLFDPVELEKFIESRRVELRGTK